MSEAQFRPLIAVVRRAPDRTVVEVALDSDGWITDGEAEVLDGDMPQAAGHATCMAVNALLRTGVEVRLAGVQHVEASPVSREVVLSAVVLVVDGAEAGEQLLGAAFVRHDVEVAAVRATLDGLTRRLTPDLRR